MAASILLAASADLAMSSLMSLWQLTVDVSDLGRVHPFDGRPDSEEMSVWMINLPTDGEEARRSLAQQETILTEHQMTFEQVEQYLQCLAIFKRRGQSFSGGQVDSLFQEEAALWQRLQVPLHSRGADYGLGDTMATWVSGGELVQEFQQFMAQVSYLLRPTMQIRSEQTNCLVAQTVVQATGQLETVWRQGLQSLQKALHQETVKMTLSTRQAVLRFLSHITAGAAAVATRLAVAPVLALPAVLRFARDVIRYAKQDQLMARIQQLSTVETTD